MNLSPKTHPHALDETANSHVNIDDKEWNFLLLLQQRHLNAKAKSTAKMRSLRRSKTL